MVSASAVKYNITVEGNLTVGNGGYDYGFKKTYYGSFDQSYKIDSVIYHQAHQDYEVIVASHETGITINSQICTMTIYVNDSSIGSAVLFQNTNVPTKYNSSDGQEIQLDKYYGQTVRVKLEFS